MEARELNKQTDLAMHDKFERWLDQNEDRVKNFEGEIAASNDAEDKNLAKVFKILHLYSENVDELKAYLAFEYDESSPKDAVVIAGGYMAISSSLNQDKKESADAYLHVLTQNENRDRRSFTIKRLLKTYNPEYRYEDVLRNMGTRDVA